MVKFKVGDKVRVIAKDHVKYSEGDTFKIVSIDEDGDVYDGNSDCILKERVELVAATPTKKQRITTLEQQVSELQAEVAALKQASKPTVNFGKGSLIVSKETDVAEIAHKLAKVLEGEKRTLTPTELRKVIIAEAKAFVAETSTFVSTDYSWQKSPSRKHREAGTLKVKFEVNAEKRTVVALVHLKFAGGLAFKAIAKCAPDDVFNADIGKAIALGRALCLDVKRFEQAVKPTEVVVGMRVYERECDEINVVTRMREDIDSDETEEYGGGKAFTTDTAWICEGQVVIVDDTEAKY